METAPIIATMSWEDGSCCYYPYPKLSSSEDETKPTKPGADSPARKTNDQ